MDRSAQEVLAQRVREAADGELRREVHGAVLVRLATGGRAEVDDVAAVVDVRQAQAGHAQEAEDVRLDHSRLVLVRRLPERVAAEAEAGVVDQDVDPAEVGHGALDEALAALTIGHVEVEGVEPLGIPQDLDATGADCHARAGLREGMRSRRPDPARGARDDRGLAVQRGQDGKP